MGRSRVLIVRVDKERLLGVSGGILVQVVVTHANMKVEVRDDSGVEVVHRSAELAGVKGC